MEKVLKQCKPLENYFVEKLKKGLASRNNDLVRNNFENLIRSLDIAIKAYNLGILEKIILASYDKKDQFWENLFMFLELEKGYLHWKGIKSGHCFSKSFDYLYLVFSNEDLLEFTVKKLNHELKQINLRFIQFLGTLFQREDGASKVDNFLSMICTVIDILKCSGKTLFDIKYDEELVVKFSKPFSDFFQKNKSLVFFGKDFLPFFKMHMNSGVRNKLNYNQQEVSLLFLENSEFDKTKSYKELIQIFSVQNYKKLIEGFNSKISISKESEITIGQTFKEIIESEILQQR